MTLSLRLVLYLAALAVALAVLACVSIVTLRGLNQRLSAALSDYDRLRWCYESGLVMVRVREALLQEQASEAFIQQRLAAATLSIERWGGPGRPAPDAALRRAVLDHLNRASSALRGEGEAAGREAALHEIRAALNGLSAQSHEIRQHINQLEAQALAAQRQAQWVVSSLAAVLLIGAVAVGVGQYRAVMGPVQRLRLSARRLAAGGWEERVPLGGDRELAEMAQDFNRMAEELEAVYQDLEAKVRSRSEQLVRSERLASVGLLAAGVAHEINNPLAIIAGQAEMAARKADARGDAEAGELCRLILEETFRCKSITQKLLSLSRPAPQQRQTVSLNQLVAAAVDAVRGLAARKGCRLSVQAGEDEGPRVRADEMELRQVLINLLLNAVSAVPADTGFIDVAVRADAGDAVITVADNGDGMDADTLDRLFDPFFTRRAHESGYGHGLGLSVSLAIVASHGGRLEAHSDGPGRGSRLAVRLPLELPAHEAVR